MPTHPDSAGGIPHLLAEFGRRIPEGSRPAVDERAASSEDYHLDRPQGSNPVRAHDAVDRTRDAFEEWHDANRSAVAVEGSLRHGRLLRSADPLGQRRSPVPALCRAPPHSARSCAPSPSLARTATSVAPSRRIRSTVAVQLVAMPPTSSTLRPSMIRRTSASYHACEGSGGPSMTIRVPEDPVTRSAFGHLGRMRPLPALPQAESRSPDRDRAPGLAIIRQVANEVVSAELENSHPGRGCGAKVSSWLRCSGAVRGATAPPSG